MASQWSAGRWQHQPFLDMISDRLERIRTEPVFLLVSAPPRHGKSELISHWLPSWFLANWPCKRVGLASYSAIAAARWGRSTRNTLETNLERTKIGLSQDLTGAANWQLDTGGGMMSVGIGGRFTGYGFDLIVIDDPIKNRAGANSPAFRESLWDWWRSTARTSLEPGGSIVVDMTRWHEDDLVGKLENSGSGADYEFARHWEMLRFPAIAEDGDILGRQVGEPLWGERFDLGALNKLREVSGLRDWAGLYQQRPAEEGGNILKDYWWHFIQIEPGPILRTYQFWDTAFKPGQENDYSCCVTASAVPGGYYIRDVWKYKLTFPDLKKAVKTLNQVWRPERVCVEDAASGQSLIQEMRKIGRNTAQDSLPVPVVAVPVGDDQVTRAHSITGLMEAGKIMLPEGAVWLPDFLRSTSLFPNAVHDDDVVAFVGVIDELRKRDGGTQMVVGPNTR